MKWMLYVYKSMPDKLLHSWRNTIIFILMMVMTGALFFSRALLSLSMMLFVIISFLHSDIKRQIRQFFLCPLLWGMSVLFFIPLLTGLWSADREQWLATLQIKLPLLFLPLAFAGPFFISEKQWNVLAYFFLLLISGATVWCLAKYLPNTAIVNEAYLKAKTIITPLENDHVRFSWLVNVGILLAGWLCIQEINKQRHKAFLFAMVTTWLIVFLHILATRTGLVSFYIILLLLAIWLLVKKIKWQYGLALIALVFLLPVIAFNIVPTFKNKVKYMMYEFDFFKHANYLPGSNDGMRIISIKAGWQIMKQEPVTGVGFGDIMYETRQWYAKHYPQMIEADKIKPGSEWMIYGAAAGIPGIIFFTIVMAVPFFITVKEKLPWYMLNSSAAFSLLFDIGLEVQFGVFVYSFIILWWWKWLKAEKI